MGEKQQYVARYLFRSAVAILCVFCATGTILAIKWPFTEKKLIQSLERLSKCEVTVSKFRRVYFPHPGYVAETVILTRKSQGGMMRMASIRMLQARASWMAMLTFTHRVRDLELQGLQVDIPAKVPRPMDLQPPAKSSTTVTTLIADGAVLEIAPSSPGSSPSRFVFKQLTLQNVEKNKSIAIQTVADIPEPPGEVEVYGRVGPFKEGAPGQTPLQGVFGLLNLDLGKFQAIRGMLQGHGDFRGTLQDCNLRGTAIIPSFEVSSSGHSFDLSTNFKTLVNALNKTVVVQSLQSYFLHTELEARGSIASKSGEKNKTVSMDIRSAHARVEDLLWVFAKTNPPALKGPLSFTAETVLPPGGEPFLRRVQLDGPFTIPDAMLTHVNTREKLNELSQRARKKGKNTEPEQVDVGLKGRVHLRNGTAMLSQLLFTTPGARAQGEGTYDLLNKQIDLRGKLAMQASLSRAAGGLKSIFLIPLDPFFKKKHAGAVLPIKITGTYSHPSFGLSLTGKK